MSQYNCYQSDSESAHDQKSLGTLHNLSINMTFEYKRKIDMSSLTIIETSNHVILLACLNSCIIVTDKL